MARKRPSVGAKQVQRSFDAVVWASICGAVLVAYWPALNGAPVWDDASHITSPALQSLHGLWRIWFDLGATQQYYPLLHSAFWLEHRVWGDAPLGYHLINVLLHAVSACLVVGIVRRFSLPGAWLAGLVFALHPVCVEAVAWISEQKSTLSGVFYLGAALLYLRFDQSRRRKHYLWAMALFVLALLSKTVTATLPAALLVVFWWQRGRLDVQRDVRPLLPWFALGAAAGLFTAWVERTYIGAAGQEFSLTPLDRILLAGRAICFYAAKAVVPVSLTFTYPHWRIESEVWWQYAFPVAVLAAAAVLWFVARKHRGPLAGFLFFAGTLFPVLGFLNVYPFRFSYVADHFQYLAILGIIVPATAAIKLNGRRAGVAVVFIAILGILTFRQSGDYRDAEALYRATLSRNPASWMAHTNLGVVLADNPTKLPEAIAEYQAALRLNPDDAPTHADLGNALAQTPGRLSDAVAEFRTALRLKPNAVQTHSDLGVALSQTPGGLAAAIDEFHEALRLKPDYAEAHDNLGVALTQMPGRLPEAIAEFQEALRFKPDYADARNNLARALAQKPERLPDAIAAYESALRANPNDAETHRNLAMALEQTPNRLSDAVTEFQAVVRLKPDDAEAHSDLGVDLAQLPGRLPEAIAELKQAVLLRPDYVYAHMNLANALVQSPGRLEEAIAEYQTTLRLEPNEAQAHNGLGVALAQMPGRMAEAIVEFQTALRLKPDYPEARNNLARACPKCLP